MKRYLKICALGLLLVAFCALAVYGFISSIRLPKKTVHPKTVIELDPETTEMLSAGSEEGLYFESEPLPVIVKSEEDIKDDYPLTDEEIDLIALVTMAEAEGECEEGKRLVIDTILNRVDHDRFPNTVKEVVYQKNQFSSMWNGRADRCYIQDEIVELVKEELKERYNSDVIFFNAGGYSAYGTPLFKVENHYFSSY